MNRSLSGAFVKKWVECPEKAIFEFERDIDSSNDEHLKDRRNSQLRQVLWRVIRDYPDQDRVFEHAQTEFTAELEGGPDLHSQEQYDQERRILMAMFNAFWDSFSDSISGMRELSADLADRHVVGSDLSLLTNVAGTWIVTDIDFLTVVDDQLLAIELYPNRHHLGNGNLKYWNDYDDEQTGENIVEKHFQGDLHHPRAAGELLRSYAVHRGLKRFVESSIIDPQSIQHLHVSVQDTSAPFVDWRARKGTISLDRINMTKRYDGGDNLPVHDVVNDYIEDQFLTQLEAIRAKDMAMDAKWEEIRNESCEYCSYAVACPHFISSEVRFYGA